MALGRDQIAAAFPEFEIDEEPLGQGTFKVAYRVRAADEDFVLKIVLESLEGAEEEGEPAGEPAPEVPERVGREIRAMQAVHSEHVAVIVQGPDVREIDGRRHIWYLEPFYAGGTLDKLLSGPLTRENVLKLGRGLLAAVRDLWEQGKLVHRDIKPKNIAFDSEGRPIVLDLGIALHVELISLTASNALSPRTEAYAAPEQFVPRRLAKIDFRTDLFLVGVVLFESLTGKHPFRPVGDRDAYIERLSSGDFDKTALQAIPNEEELKSVILRLIKPKPHERFRTLSRTIDSLEEAGK